MHGRWRQVAAVLTTAGALLAGGGHVAAQAATAEPDWLRALRLRSEALNCLYGLGDTSGCRPVHTMEGCPAAPADPKIGA
jgi:hypothetical protein